MGTTHTSPPHHATPHDPDVHKGAIEGDRPSDEQQANENAVAIDDEGIPTKKDAVAISEDVIGANEDQSSG